jgi:hemoglobin
MMTTPNEPMTIYALVGGAQTFWQLVDCFYARVEADPHLRPMFPDDLEPGKRWQALFLMQFFGGGADYSMERGHPRLRMRHGAFPIDAAAQQRWLGHMLAAIDEVGIAEPMRSVMIDYFVRASQHMINREPSASDK